MQRKMNSTDITIRGFHIDVFGHTNNARYLEFMEIARWEALDPIIASGFFSQRNLGFVIVNININYRAASFVNDVLEIQSTVKTVGQKSIVVHQIMQNKRTGQAICDADVTFVILNLETRKSVLLEGELRTIFQNL